MKPPLADPTETPRFTGADARIFRIRPWLYGWRTLISSLLFSVPLSGILLFVVRPRFDLAVWLLIAGGVSIYLAVICFGQGAIAFWTAPVKLSSWGLYAFAYWGASRQAQWSQIVSVRLKARWQVVPYAVATISDGRRLYIPLCLKNWHEFVQTVALHVESDHPLRVFLEARETEAR